MKKAMSDRAHAQVRERLDRARERGRREEEVQLAAAIKAEFPELDRSECLRRAHLRVLQGPLWKIVKGTTTVGVRGNTYAEAIARAKQIGIVDPDSVVLL